MSIPEQRFLRSTTPKASESGREGGFFEAPRLRSSRTVPLGTASPSPLGGRGRGIGGNTIADVSDAHRLLVAAIRGGG